MSTALQQRDRLAGILGRIQTQMGEVLPRHLDPETMTRIVLVEGARNPKIGRCTAESIATTVMLASQLGLQPSSPLGHFYLIPRNEQGPNGDRVMRCGYVIGYRGYLELARRAGLRMNAGVVSADEIERGSFSWTVEPPAIDHAGALGVRRTDDSLVLAVRDSGKGFDGEQADRLFEPFFTTKPQGTGMGLSINRTIIEAHGGRIWATANRNRGATFYFCLPAATEVGT